MTNAPDERGLELRELFFETSQELLQALNEEALKLEKKPGDEEIVRVIRRTVHTLKGDSAACGLRELSELAHQFEDALSIGGAATQAAVAEIAFATADVFVEMISAYRSGGKMPSTKALSKKIQDLTAVPVATKAKRSRKGAGKTAKTAAEKAAAKVAALWTEYETLAMTKAQATGLSVYHVVVKIDPHCAMPIAGRQLVHNALAAIGQVLAVRPEAKSPAATKFVEFVLASSQTVEQIATKGRIPTIAEDVTVELMLEASVVAAQESTAAAEIPAGEILPEVEANVVPPQPMASPIIESTAHATENILRVEAGRIDNVLNLVGELIIGKSMLQQALI